MSNLRLINETEITSSVSYIDVNNIFSADFDTYCIEYSTVGSAGNALRGNLLNTSGVLLNGSDYDNAMINQIDSGAFTESRNQGDTRWERISIHSPYGQNATTWIFNPYTANYTFVITQGVTYYNAAGIGTYAQKQAGVYKQTTSIGGIRFTPASGTLDSGIIRTYGLRVDS
jgi:hypothetical protein